MLDFLIPNFSVKYQPVNCDVTTPINEVKPLPLNVEFLKLYSCQISFSSELSNLLFKVSGRRNTHI